MKKFTVGIVGLGLIGASFAKGYQEAKKQDGDDITILGFNRTHSVVERSLEEGIIDGELTSESLKDCDIVIICNYPEACIKYMEDNKANFKKNGLVIDACGNKRIVCIPGFKIAKENGFVFVGGHPMAGNKYSGMDYAKGDMYVGAPMVVVPENREDTETFERVKYYLEPLKFGSYCLSDAEHHDKMIAFTSQMAHLVSNAYIKSPSARLHEGFSAGSYKDMTRVAWLNPQMWTELFMQNRDNLINEIDILIDELNKYRKALDEEDSTEMERLLDEGRRIKEEVDG